MRRTYGDVKEDLRAIAGQTGLAADDVRLRAIVDLAQENLLTKAKTVVGTTHRLVFAQFDGVIALPPRYERIVDVAIDKVPRQIFGHWFEFVDYGPGPASGNTSISGLVDRGESPIHRHVIEPAVLRVYGKADERVSGVRPKIRFLGYDENGVWIRTQSGGTWVDGEEVEIDGDSADAFKATTAKFSRVVQVIKPRTNAPVEVYAYDPMAEEMLKFAARYEHWETNPTRRLYAVPSIVAGEKSVTVHANALVRFRKIEDDSTELIVSSLPALRHAVRAIAKENADDVVAADASWTLAVQALNDQARRYYGTPNPAVTVRSTAGAYGGIPNIL